MERKRGREASVPPSLALPCGSSLTGKGRPVRYGSANSRQSGMRNVNHVLTLCLVVLLHGKAKVICH